ncbi:E3 ubiquitin-protein ligase RHA2A [Juglans microcarpa x Juglans regia]|uniref:E3 ubiquitin-protein ligase RHA2A n=1 Tax=Juglans microcarpa x Juglans regia TaxID=2249226 RepID=UPI001B7DA1FB|nr:E3 ubiquitin-protein ligase RHA2A [Juglans microcarpa x Juglans regia]
MGLQSQLNDVSSDSIPLLLLALFAKCVSYLRSVVSGLFHSLGLSRFNPDSAVDDGFVAAVGSGLAGLIVLADQLNLNRVFSYEYLDSEESDLVGRPDCVVCLSALRDGDQVRRLACLHVFHKECFDGWLNHLKFTCPICRSPQVCDERVSLTDRRVGGDLLAWFSVR